MLLLLFCIRREKQRAEVHQGRNPLVPPVAQQPTPGSKGPGRVPGAEPHHSCVSTHNTFVLFSCSVFDCLCIDIVIQECSFFVSLNVFFVFQYVVLSFLASVWRMWNFLFLANQTNDTVVVVGNKPVVVHSF